jgi:hypothetical protein
VIYEAMNAGFKGRQRGGRDCAVVHSNENLENSFSKNKDLITNCLVSGVINTANRKLGDFIVEYESILEKALPC